MSARRSGLAILLLITTAPAPDALAENRTLRHIVYDYAVTSYCGLLSPEVEQGFQQELAAETARNGLDAEAAKAQRIAGWVDADREWSNRGLGGFKAWCASDGADAAARFLAVAREAR